MNRVILIGNLGNDPDFRQTEKVNVCRLNLATQTKTKKAGEYGKEYTEWHHVVMFDKLADISHKYLSKGDKVAIEGRLQTKKWKDGKHGVDRYKTEIVAHEMEMLGQSGYNKTTNEAKQPPQQQLEIQTSNTQNLRQTAQDNLDDIPW